MVKHSSDRADALLDLPGPGTVRSAPPRPRREPDGMRVVRVPLCEGSFELRVPSKAAKAKK
jgi:hypothetical protein